MLDTDEALGPAVLEALNAGASPSGQDEPDRYREVLEAARLKSWPEFRRKARIVHVARESDGRVVVGPDAPRAAGLRSRRRGPRQAVDPGDHQALGTLVKERLVPDW